MSTVTVSLVTYNSERYIRDFAKSLLSQTFKDWHLLIVDNNSSDNTVAAVGEWLPQAKIMRQKNNLGFAKAHNLIMQWSKSDYVLVINPDVIMTRGCLEKLVACMDGHEEIASIGGKLLYWDFATNTRTQRIDSFGLTISRAYRVRDLHQGEADTAIPGGYVFGITGALVLLRRSALEQVKVPTTPSAYEYFDEDFFVYKEDVDLAWRFILAGWKHYFYPDALAFHHRAVSSLASSRQERKKRSAINRYSYRNHLLMVYKNQLWPLTLKNIVRIVWFEAGKFFYLLLLDGSSLAGLREAIALLPRFSRKRRFVQAVRRVQPKEFEQWLTT